ncbi:YeeE/YedE family protein [Polynucleobacter sp. CS-Odin-A6]|uniref:YeeE/YedE family protein n=1 Tax=Polynucleobacter sp. CS-Odin-A6 TaxID=2689106 RepID=UPI001C0E83AE|nr:YeeE/YedE family protein [Polynucleobacter sp. CS-Odin-A6]MBU3621662.1 YeeE/YedE family protein [Polynucleobacter sp. CS-Odin-A6]
MRRYFHLYSQYFIGVLFGLGLIISGMCNPQKILNFLDITGDWDPSLIFVMGGAVIVGLGGFYFASKRALSFFDGALHIPSKRDISRPLVIGSLIFGAGWGIAGFCPGPAIVALGAGHIKAVVFVLAMLAGMVLCNRFFTGHSHSV